MPTYTVRVEYPVIAWAIVPIEAGSPREAADKAAAMGREGELDFRFDDETLADQDSFLVAEGEVECPSEEHGAIGFLSACEQAREEPTVLVDIRGGNVQQVIACGDVRVLILDHDNPSFAEDAVDDRVDAAMMERLIDCSRDLIDAHERGLAP